MRHKSRISTGGRAKRHPPPGVVICLEALYRPEKPGSRFQTRTLPYRSDGDRIYLAGIGLVKITSTFGVCQLRSCYKDDRNVVSSHTFHPLAGTWPRFDVVQRQVANEETILGPLV